MPISATPRPSGSSGNAPAVTNGKALAVVTTIFFMWGFLTCLNDILIPHLKAVFELNYAKAMLVQFTFFGAYFLMSLPAGRLVAHLGYIGNVVGNLIISYVTAVFTQDKENYTNWLNNSIEETMASFINTYNTNFLKDVKTPMFNTEEFKEYYLTSIYSDTLGYAATEMIRRTVGVAKVWDLERNKTHDQMAKIERFCV